MEEAEATEIEVVQAEKDVAAEMVKMTGQQRRTKSVAAIRVVPEKKSGKKAVKGMRATDESLGLDLDEAMEDTEIDQIMTTTMMTTIMMTTTMMMASTLASTIQTTAEVYARPYSKSAESRGEWSSARQEKKKIMEKELKEQQEKESKEKVARLQERKEQHEASLIG